MPKEVKEIRGFASGTVFNASEEDISREGNSFSLNINPIAKDGILEAINADKEIVSFNTASALVLSPVTYTEAGALLSLNQFPGSDVTKVTFIGTKGLIEELDVEYWEPYLESVVTTDSNTSNVLHIHWPDLSAAHWTDIAQNTSIIPISYHDVSDDKTTDDAHTYLTSGDIIQLSSTFDISKELMQVISVVRNGIRYISYQQKQYHIVAGGSWLTDMVYSNVSPSSSLVGKGSNLRVDITSGSSFTTGASKMGNLTVTVKNHGNDYIEAPELFDTTVVNTDNISNFTAQGSNTVADDSGDMKVTYVNNVIGFKFLLRHNDSNDLTSNLIVGKQYRLAFSAKTNASMTAKIRNTGGTELATVTMNTSSQWDTFALDFFANATNTDYFSIEDMTSTEIIWIRELHLFEYDNVIRLDEPGGSGYIEIAPIPAGITADDKMKYKNIFDYINVTRQIKNSPNTILTKNVEYNIIKDTINHGTPGSGVSSQEKAKRGILHLSNWSNNDGNHLGGRGSIFKVGATTTASKTHKIDASAHNISFDSDSNAMIIKKASEIFAGLSSAYFVGDFITLYTSSGISSSNLETTLTIVKTDKDLTYEYLYFKESVITETHTSGTFYIEDNIINNLSFYHSEGLASGEVAQNWEEIQNYINVNEANFSTIVKRSNSDVSLVSSGGFYDSTNVSYLGNADKSLYVYPWESGDKYVKIVSGYQDTTLDLSTNIGASDTVIYANDSTRTARYMRKGLIIKIDSEYMYINAISGNIIEVERGYYASLIAAHTSGTSIFMCEYNGIRQIINKTRFNNEKYRLYIKAKQIGAVRAIASITIADYTAFTNGDTLKITSTNGIEYTYTKGSANTVYNNTFAAATSNNQTSINLAAIIDANPNFAAQAVGPAVQIIQQIAGSDGNTTVVLTEASGDPWNITLNFTGGSAAIEPPVVTCQIKYGGGYLTSYGHILEGDYPDFSREKFINFTYFSQSDSDMHTITGNQNLDDVWRTYYYDIDIPKIDLAEDLTIDIMNIGQDASEFGISEVSMCKAPYITLINNSSYDFLDSGYIKRSGIRDLLLYDSTSKSLKILSDFGGDNHILEDFTGDLQFSASKIAFSNTNKEVHIGCGPETSDSIPKWVGYVTRKSLGVNYDNKLVVERDCVPALSEDDDFFQFNPGGNDIFTSMCQAGEYEKIAATMDSSGSVGDTNTHLDVAFTAHGLTVGTNIIVREYMDLDMTWEGAGQWVITSVATDTFVCNRYYDGGHRIPSNLNFMDAAGARGESGGNTGFINFRPAYAYGVRDSQSLYRACLVDFFKSDASGYDLIRKKGFTEKNVNLGLNLEFISKAWNDKADGTGGGCVWLLVKTYPAVLNSYREQSLQKYKIESSISTWQSDNLILQVKYIPKLVNFLYDNITDSFPNEVNSDYGFVPTVAVGLELPEQTHSSGGQTMQVIRSIIETKACTAAYSYIQDDNSHADVAPNTFDTRLWIALGGYRPSDSAHLPLTRWLFCAKANSEDVGEQSLKFADRTPIVTERKWVSIPQGVVKLTQQIRDDMTLASLGSIEIGLRRNGLLDINTPSYNNHTFSSISTGSYFDFGDTPGVNDPDTISPGSPSSFNAFGSFNPVYTVLSDSYNDGYVFESGVKARYEVQAGFMLSSFTIATGQQSDYGSYEFGHGVGHGLKGLNPEASSYNHYERIWADTSQNKKRFGYINFGENLIKSINPFEYGDTQDNNYALVQIADNDGDYLIDGTNLQVISKETASHTDSTGTVTYPYGKQGMRMCSHAVGFIATISIGDAGRLHSNSLNNWAVGNELHGDENFLDTPSRQGRAGLDHYGDTVWQDCYTEKSTSNRLSNHGNDNDTQEIHEIDSFNHSINFVNSPKEGFRMGSNFSGGQSLLICPDIHYGDLNQTNQYIDCSMIAYNYSQGTSYHRKLTSTVPHKLQATDLIYIRHTTTTGTNLFATAHTGASVYELTGTSFYVTAIIDDYNFIISTGTDEGFSVGTNVHDVRVYFGGYKPISYKDADEEGASARLRDCGTALTSVNHLSSTGDAGKGEGPIGGTGKTLYHYDYDENDPSNPLGYGFGQSTFKRRWYTENTNIGPPRLLNYFYTTKTEVRTSDFLNGTDTNFDGSFNTVGQSAVTAYWDPAEYLPWQYSDYTEGNGGNFLPSQGFDTARNAGSMQNRRAWDYLFPQIAFRCDGLNMQAGVVAKQYYGGDNITSQVHPEPIYHINDGSNKGSYFQHKGTNNAAGKNIQSSYIQDVYGIKHFLNRPNSGNKDSRQTRNERRFSKGELVYDYAASVNSSFNNYISQMINYGLESNFWNDTFQSEWLEYEAGLYGEEGHAMIGQNFVHWAGFLTGEEGTWEMHDVQNSVAEDGAEGAQPWLWFNSDGEPQAAPANASYDGFGWNFENSGWGSVMALPGAGALGRFSNTLSKLSRKHGLPTQFLGIVKSYIKANTNACPDATIHPVIRVYVSPSSLYLCNVKELGPEEIPGFSAIGGESFEEAEDASETVDKSMVYNCVNRTFWAPYKEDFDNYDGTFQGITIASHPLNDSSNTAKCDWVEHGTAGNKWTADSGICHGSIDLAAPSSGSFATTQGLINGVVQPLLTGAFETSVADAINLGGYLHLKDNTSSGTANKYVRLFETFWAHRNDGSSTQKLVVGRNYLLEYSIQVKTFAHADIDIKVGIYQGDTAQHVNSYLGSDGDHTVVTRGQVSFTYAAADDYICVELIKGNAAAGTEVAFGQVSLRENERSQLHGGPWYKHGKARYVLQTGGMAGDFLPPKNYTTYSGAYQDEDTKVNDLEGQMLGFHHLKTDYIGGSTGDRIPVSWNSSNQDYAIADTGCTDLRNINAPVRSFYRVRNVFAGMYLVLKQKYATTALGFRQIRKIIGSYSLGKEVDSEMAFVINKPFTLEPVDGDVIELITHSQATTMPMQNPFVGYKTEEGYGYKTYSATSDSSEALTLCDTKPPDRDIYDEVLEEKLLGGIAHGINYAAVSFNTGTGVATMTQKAYDSSGELVTVFHHLYTGQRIIIESLEYIITALTPSTFSFTTSNYQFDNYESGQILSYSLNYDDCNFSSESYWPSSGNEANLSFYGGADFSSLRTYNVTQIEQNKNADGTTNTGGSRLHLDATGHYHHLKVGDAITLRRASGANNGTYFIINLDGAVTATPRYIGINVLLTATSDDYTLYCPRYSLFTSAGDGRFTHANFGPTHFDVGKWLGNGYYPLHTLDINTEITDTLIQDFCFTVGFSTEGTDGEEEDAGFFTDVLSPMNQEEGAFFKKNNAYKYALSLMYDGYQEGPLTSEPIATHHSQQVDYKMIKVQLALLQNISPRLSHLCVYRKDNELEPYRLVKQVPVDNQWILNEHGYWIQSFEDDGQLGATFDTRAGISEHLESVTIKYGLSQEAKGYLFIGDCYHPKVPNSENIIFRSLPGKFSIFNWAYHFLQLKSKPTAMASFNNKLYVFDEFNTYTINPDLLVIEKTFRGVGCLSPKSVEVTEFGMFYADRNGAYWHDGSNPKKISKPIQTGGDSDILSYSNSSTVGSSLVPDLSWKATAGVDSHMIPIVLYSPENQNVLFIVESNHRQIRTSGVYSEEFNKPRYYAWSFQLEKLRWDLWELSSEEKPTAAMLGKNGELCITIGSTIYHYGGADYKRPYTWISKKLNMDSASQLKVFRKIHLTGIPDRLNKASNDDDKFGGDRLIIATNNGRIDNSDLTYSKDDAGNSSYLVSGTNKKGNWVQIKLEDMTDPIDAISLIFRRKAIK